MGSAYQPLSVSVFFFNDTATTEIYTLSLHDALPIWDDFCRARPCAPCDSCARRQNLHRSEEHTSELQSRQYLVCRLLLEEKLYNRDDPQALARAHTLSIALTTALAL